MLPDMKRHRFMQVGIRFYENENERFALMSSVDDYDKDEKITVYSTGKGRSLELLDNLESDFSSSWTSQEFV